MFVRKFTWWDLASAIPIFCIPFIIFGGVEDRLTSSVLLSLACGTSTVILAIQDYFHHKVKGEWRTPRLSTPLVVAGSIAMLIQIVLFASGIRGWYYIALQMVVMVMFVHSAWREWKRWM